VTAAETLHLGERVLHAAGLTTAGLDAETLLRYVCGWDRAQLVVALPQPLPPATETRFRELVDARARRRPLQHLTGRQWFWRHEFAVSPAVLIPRGETELLVESTLARLSGVTAPLVVDVGTGSGCIAISLALERPDLRVLAVDIAPAALEVARANAEESGVLARVALLVGDLLEPIASGRQSLDAIVSNPPYVDPTEREALAPEVRDHEPALALFAPGDRYSVYRRLVPAASERLRAGGWLLLEVGMGMADEVARLCAQAALRVDSVQRDLQSIPRVLAAQKG